MTHLVQDDGTVVGRISKIFGKHSHRLEPELCTPAERWFEIETKLVEKGFNLSVVDSFIDTLVSVLTPISSIIDMVEARFGVFLYLGCC